MKNKISLNMEIYKKNLKRDLKVYEIRVSKSEKENLDKTEKLIFKILKDGESMVVISLVD